MVLEQLTFGRHVGRIGGEGREGRKKWGEGVLRRGGVGGRGGRRKGKERERIST